MIPYQRALRGSAFLLGFSLLGTSSLLSEESTTPAIEPASATLETTTVVANRLAVPLTRSGSAVTVLDGETLEAGSSPIYVDLHGTRQKSILLPDILSLLR